MKRNRPNALHLNLLLEVIHVSWVGSSGCWGINSRWSDNVNWDQQSLKWRGYNPTIKDKLCRRVFTSQSRTQCVRVCAFPQRNALDRDKQSSTDNDSSYNDSPLKGQKNIHLNFSLRCVYQTVFLHLYICTLDCFFIIFLYLSMILCTGRASILNWKIERIIPQ